MLRGYANYRVVPLLSTINSGFKNSIDIAILSDSNCAYPSFLSSALFYLYEFFS